MAISLISFAAGTQIKSADVNANFNSLLTGTVLVDGTGATITGRTVMQAGGGWQGYSDSRDRIGIGTFGSLYVEMISNTHYAFLAGGQAGSVGWNFYNDGTNERFLTTVAAPGAYQILASALGVRVRKSTNASPAADAIITWGAFTVLFS